MIKKKEIVFLHSLRTNVSKAHQSGRCYQNMFNVNLQEKGVIKEGDISIFLQ